MIYAGIVIALIVVVIPGSRLMQNNEDGYLSLEQTKCVKGICAVLVMIHHIMQVCIDLPLPFQIMNYVGFILVALFFFFSGYGLMSGIQKKNNYLNGFLSRRLLSILVPYWIVNTLYIIFDTCNGIMHTWLDYGISWMGIDSITGTWFVTAILVLYIVFYISFKYLSEENAVRGILAFTLLYIVICMILKLHSSWTASITTFVLGIYWCKYEKKILNFFRVRYGLKLMTISISFVLLFLGRLVLVSRGVQVEILHLILRNVISILFVTMVLVSMLKIKIGNNFLKHMGNISYELYILHQLCIRVVSNHLKNGKLGIVVIILSLVSACILRGIDKKMFGYIKKFFSPRRENFKKNTHYS